MRRIIFLSIVHVQYNRRKHCMQLREVRSENYNVACTREEDGSCCPTSHITCFTWQSFPRNYHHFRFQLETFLSRTCFRITNQCKSIMVKTDMRTLSSDEGTGCKCQNIRPYFPFLIEWLMRTGYLVCILVLQRQKRVLNVCF